MDFRGFQLVNIYGDANAFVNAKGFERPGAREVNGDVMYTMRHEVQAENVLGRGDSWAMSGGQWGAWNATYGPRGADGLPVPLWDPKTGELNRSVVEHWKKYDLRLHLELLERGQELLLDHLHALEQPIEDLRIRLADHPAPDTRKQEELCAAQGHAQARRRFALRAGLVS